MKKMSLVLLPFLALASVCAQAQTAPAAPAAAASAPDPTFLSAVTGNINLTSNYKFRGQDQGTLKGLVACGARWLRLEPERLLRRQLELEHQLRR